jgi:prevent-host-death family protein
MWEQQGAGMLRQARVCINVDTSSVSQEIPLTTTTISAREFNQDTGRAKRAAAEGPVFITDRGEPAHVLLSIEEYRRITGKQMSLLEALAQPDIPGMDMDFEFEPPRLNIGLKPADFS